MSFDLQSVRDALDTITDFTQNPQATIDKVNRGKGLFSRPLVPDRKDLELHAGSAPADAARGLSLLADRLDRINRTVGVSAARW